MIAERRGRRRPRGRRFALPTRLVSRRFAAVLAAAVVLLAGGWLWFRSSSFVAVNAVRVTGLGGPDVTQITRALINKAETMTTLNFDVSALQRSVAAYPYVHSLNVSTHFPHGVTIDVVEHVPVATVWVDGRTKTVDGAGQLLPSAATVHSPLPSVPIGPVSTTTWGTSGVAANPSRITAPGSLAALTVLAAAPYGFLPHIARALSSSEHGVVIQLRNGPQVYFGPVAQLADKWTAALAVLSARGAAAAVGAAYIDVSDPQRPAVGAHVPPASSSGATSTGLTTTPAGGASGST